MTPTKLRVRVTLELAVDHFTGDGWTVDAIVKTATKEANHDLARALNGTRLLVIGSATPVSLTHDLTGGES